MRTEPTTARPVRLSRALRHHLLILTATISGVAGTGVVFSGAMDANLRVVEQGTPFLLIGLWWAGRELGASIALARSRNGRGSPRR